MVWNSIVQPALCRDRQYGGEGLRCVARNLSASARLPGAVDRASNSVGTRVAPWLAAAALPVPRLRATLHRVVPRHSEGLAENQRISADLVLAIAEIVAQAPEIPECCCKSAARCVL